jgi:hypothetical protein
MVKTITITNDTTDEAISVTRTWAKTDVLEVNTLNKTVLVNGTAVDYEGVFPIFSPGTHNLIISHDLGVSTLTVTCDYTKRYL